MRRLLVLTIEAACHKCSKTTIFHPIFLENQNHHSIDDDVSGITFLDECLDEMMCLNM